jgi:hypothetical protein
VGRQNTGNSSVAGSEQAARILRVAEGQTEELQTSMASEGPPSAAGCRTGEDQRRSVIDSLHYKIAEEAVKLHLDAPEPWKHSLNDLGGIGMVFGPDNAFSVGGGFEYNMDPETPDNYSTTTMEHHAALGTQPVEKLLWNAYFSQAKTEGEKQALLRKVRENYKITVIDPDFFDGQTNP